MSRRRGRGKKESGGGGGSPGWMTTFSDLMSLLLTFFILLYSMSNVDAQKFESMSMSLQGVLSGFGYNYVPEGHNTPMEIPIDGDKDSDEDLPEPEIREDIQEVYDKVSGYVDSEGLDADVTVSYNKKGIFVDIKEAILFDSGSDEIKDSGLVVLGKIEGILDEFKNEIVVEGHTDNVPMNSALYPSNWELSTGRSVAVLRYLTEVGNIAPERISASGYGESRPMVENSSPENRAINRRVNILIIFDEESDKE